MEKLNGLSHRLIVGGLLSFFMVINLYARDDTQSFDQLNNLIKQEVTNKNLPLLSIVLVNENGVVWSGGAGNDAGNPGLSADGGTTYRIGSVSKLFTDIVVMQYVEQGVLDLDAPVVTYLPGFKPDNPHNIPIDDIMAYSEDIQIAEGKVKIFGTEYVAVAEAKPTPLNPAWSGLIGEYGFDHNILYISEKFGRLHALIEWGMEYPLIDLGGGAFKFPPSGLYPNEQLVFQKDEQGKIQNVSLNGINFHRRAIGSVDVEVFRIEPVKPVPILEQEALKAKQPEEKGQFRKSDLVDVTKYGETITLDIRYAGRDNFLGTPVYSSAHAFLQRPAAEALGRIAKGLKQKGYGLLVHDAYRPWYVTKIFWDATPEEGKIFVADPSQGSRHNRGAAVDLTLYDLKTGSPVDMVGLYDEMTERSFVHYPGGTSLQRWHRALLRDAMEAEGFKVYPYEWWHFDFDGWQNYRVQNDTFEELE